MQADPSLVFARWRDAEALATQAEWKLFDAALRSSSGCSTASPSAAEWNNARQIRRRAKVLFQAAMQAVHDLNARAARLTD